jgi:sec-independent protein translocase protein TatA
MSPGIIQLLVVALLVILLFGASRLSEVGRGLGDGIRSFKKGLTGDEARAAGEVGSPEFEQAGRNEKV